MISEIFSTPKKKLARPPVDETGANGDEMKRRRVGANGEAGGSPLPGAAAVMAEVVPGDASEGAGEPPSSQSSVVPSSTRKEMRRNLSSRLLIPTKIFNCPIHNFIHMDALSCEIIDTPQFQRLRALKQVSAVTR